MFEFFADVNWVEAGAALLTLTLLEIVLGIDNILVISILTGRLPEEKQRTGQIVGLGLAMVMRIILLFFITFIAGLTAPLFAVFGHEISWRDVILLSGGLFLIVKAVWEIHKNIEGSEEHGPPKGGAATLGLILVQIILLDLVFSIDSVITAVGMAKDIWVMVTAVVVAIIVMMVFAGPISRFIHDHPTIKILALAFLLLVGVTLLVEGLDQHISKGYLYFAMGFSLFVELVNLRVLKKGRPLLEAELPKKKRKPRPTA